MPNGKPTSLHRLWRSGPGHSRRACVMPASGGCRHGTFCSRSRRRKAHKAAEAIGVQCAQSAADAVRDADMVISAVTAASSVDAAQSVRAHLAGTPYLLDINSVSPGRKQETAKPLGNAARYVDVAVIAPIYPARHQTPMLLAGRMPKRSRRRSPRSACVSLSPGRRPAPRRRSRWYAAS